MYDNNTITRLVEDIIGMTFDNTLSQEIPLWGDKEKVVSYLMDNKSALESTMHRKQFASEYAMVRYFSAVVKNGIKSYIMPPPVVVKQTDNEFYESKYKPKKRRKCLSEMIEGSDTE